MELINGLHNIKDRHYGCVATLGNFDGVHLGHQQVFKKLAIKASELKLPKVAIIFEPQPQEFFIQNKSSGRLTNFKEKIKLLQGFDIDLVLVLTFNKQLAELSADDFIKDVLLSGLGVRHLVVGDDFKFGKNRTGDFSLLVKYGETNKFSVINMPTYKVDGFRVSSTAIRQALATGDFVRASILLGRPYSISGKVSHGQKLGRTIGFPTANIHLHRKVSPLSGVFAVKMYGIDEDFILGIANLGNRPTVCGVKIVLEVHLFNFNADIYGKKVTVCFLKKIREEKKFIAFDLLKEQISKDIKVAKDFFNMNINQCKRMN